MSNLNNPKKSYKPSDYNKLLKKKMRMSGHSPSYSMEFNLFFPEYLPDFTANNNSSMTDAKFDEYITNLETTLGTTLDIETLRMYKTVWKHKAQKDNLIVNPGLEQAYSSGKRKPIILLPGETYCTRLNPETYTENSFPDLGIDEMECHTIDVVLKYCSFSDNIMAYGGNHYWPSNTNTDFNLIIGTTDEKINNQVELDDKMSNQIDETEVRFCGLNSSHKTSVYHNLFRFNYYGVIGQTQIKQHLIMQNKGNAPVAFYLDGVFAETTLRSSAGKIAELNKNIIKNSAISKIIYDAAQEYIGPKLSGLKELCYFKNERKYNSTYNRLEYPPNDGVSGGTLYLKNNETVPENYITEFKEHMKNHPKVFKALSDLYGLDITLDMDIDLNLDNLGDRSLISIQQKFLFVFVKVISSGGYNVAGYQGRIYSKVDKNKRVIGGNGPANDLATYSLDPGLITIAEEHELELTIPKSAVKLNNTGKKQFRINFDNSIIFQKITDTIGTVNWGLVKPIDTNDYTGVIIGIPSGYARAAFTEGMPNSGFWVGEFSNFFGYHPNSLNDEIYNLKQRRYFDIINNDSGEIYRFDLKIIFEEKPDAIFIIKNYLHEMNISNIREEIIAPELAKLTRSEQLALYFPDSNPVSEQLYFVKKFFLHLTSYVNDFALSPNFDGEPTAGKLKEYMQNRSKLYAIQQFQKKDSIGYYLSVQDQDAYAKMVEALPNFTYPDFNGIDINTPNEELIEKYSPELWYEQSVDQTRHELLNTMRTITVEDFHDNYIIVKPKI